MLSAAAGCPDERWCAQSMRLRGRAVVHRVFCLELSFLGMLLPDTSFRMNDLVAKPSQSVNWEWRCAGSASRCPLVC